MAIFPHRNNLGNLLGNKTAVKAIGSVVGVETLGKLAKAIPVYGQVAAFAAQLIGKETINKTIGAALKYGFKCWGSSWNPGKAGEYLPFFLEKIGENYKAALNVKPEQLESSLNRFFQDFHKVSYKNRTLTEWIHWRHTTAKDCTLKGLIVLENGVNGYMETCADGVKDILRKAEITHTIARNTTTTLVTSGRKNYKLPAYKLTMNIPKGYFDEPKPQPKQNLTGKSNFIPTEDNGKKPKTNSGGIVPTIIGGLIAAVLFKRIFK